MHTVVTERSNCRFIIRKSGNEQPRLMAELFQRVSSLKDAKLGFELLNGTSVEQAKKIAAFLNEHVLNVFVETTPPAKT
jgi:hypothetical protein